MIGKLVQQQLLGAPSHSRMPDQGQRPRRLVVACQIALAGVIAVCAEVILRVWSASWRKDIEQIHLLDRLLTEGTPVLAVFWHGRYFPLFALAEGRNATVFVGQSFRGKVIARICRRFGYEAVPIPAHSHEIDAYELMIERLAKTRFGVLAVDGPLGPFHKVRSGAVRLASQLQFLIVPISVASDPKYVLTWRWDKRELPRPFATVALAVGEPIRIPKGVAPEAMSAWTTSIRTSLETTDAEAEARVRSARHACEQRVV